MSMLRWQHRLAIILHFPHAARKRGVAASAGSTKTTENRESILFSKFRAKELALLAWNSFFLLVSN